MDVASFCGVGSGVDEARRRASKVGDETELLLPGVSHSFTQVLRREASPEVGERGTGKLKTLIFAGISLALNKISRLRFNYVNFADR